MKIEIEEYNPEWPSLFENEKKLILEGCGNKIQSIKHVGSTSVPGLGAKPVIDIMIGVRKLQDADDLIPNMNSLEYEYISKYEDVMPERRYFVKWKEKKSTHHIHTVEVAGEFWKRLLLFRDYLRINDKVRDDYFNLKKELSKKEWNKGNDYADAKTDFMKGMEKEALNYFFKDN